MPSRDDREPASDAGSDLTPVYVRVLLIEVVVLAVLFWIGRHFA